MSTHTDGAAPPSVGSADDADGEGAVGAPVSGPGTTPPRRRDPAGPAPPAPPPVNGHGTDPQSGGPGEPGWVQQEIQRRIAARGASDTPRHSRSDRARTAPGDDGDPDPSPEDTPPPRTVTLPESTPRRRSTRVPDPYAPDGMRDQDGPEGPFRTPGPAAASPEPRGPAADGPPPATPPKQWPPADGAASLPRRVPGAGWTLGRRTPADSADPRPGVDDAEPETRIVPALWAVPSNGIRDTAVGAPRGSEAADGFDDRDDLDDDLLLTGLTGLTGDTEVIWRAPGLDGPPVPAPPAAADTAAVTPAAPAAPLVDGGLAPNPFTGVRPRRFAAPPTDVEPEPDVDEDARPECPDLDAAPQGKRKRIVLSERRTVAQSVRGVVDVQDPGPVGSMLRSQLVSTQLRISLQVGGVALLGLFLMPALFAAFPSLGGISVFGIRLPWLLLGFLTYPFLLLLGWWFVGSAERAEQDFIQEVQDR